jgi:hypothetical protein
MGASSSISEYNTQSVKLAAKSSTRKLPSSNETSSSSAIGYRGDIDKKTGQKHGRGIFIYENGDSYNGEWHNNKKDGEGCYRLYLLLSPIIIILYL